MKKERLTIISFLLGIFMINFVSAYSFGVSDLFDFFGAENLMLILVFLLSFVLIFFATSRMFHGKKEIAAVVSILFALGITSGIYFSGFDITMLLFDLGIEEDLFVPVGMIVGTVLGIILIKKFGFSVFLLSLGLLFGVFGFFAYEKEAAWTIAGILLGLALLWKIKKLIWKGTKSTTKFAYNQEVKRHQDYLIERKKKKEKKIEEKEKREVEEKFAKGLREMYYKYKKEAKRIYDDIGGVPQKGTREFNLYAQYLNEMNKIEVEATRRGIRL